MHLTQILKICIIIQECIYESQIFIFGLILSVAFSSCTVISHKEFVEHDYRNTNVPVVVTGIPFTGEITINMEKTDNYDFSMVDMQRCYFQAAEMWKDNDYK